MKQSLNQEQIKYVLFHLSFFVEINQFEKYFIFGENSDPHFIDRIYFPLSRKGFEIDKIVSFEGIPILFPLSSKEKPYELKNGSLIFNHDLIKSAFYLLSGYQEIKSGKTDKFGRFSYEGSIQERLGVVEKPLVNYYFNWIINGIREYSQIKKIELSIKKPFDNSLFYLSHDIDRIAKYDFYETSHKLLEFVGLKHSNFSRTQLFKLIPKYIFNFLFLPKTIDPYWNFKKLREIENSLDIRSTWFFLEKHGKHTNSRYLFSEIRIKKLIQFLKEENCEIGLHGTVESASKPLSLKSTKQNLEANCNCKVKGIRQHKLIFNYPETLNIQENAGLIYDHTLTFPAHEGFRNSYCFPFKPFDFEKNKMMNIWEIPLIVMDGTLFYYRKLTFQEIDTQIEVLIKEIKKFEGVFSMLWHNSHFDEDEFPGIENFYVHILEKISKAGFKSRTGIEIVENL